MSKVLIIDSYKQITLKPLIFEKILDSLIAKTKISPKSTLSLVVVSAEKMKKLCLEHFSNKKITDVLAFPHDDLSKLTGERDLGEIFIAASVLKKQAKEYNHSSEREWAYLFAHATLHLIGFDHDSEASEKTMHRIVESVLAEQRITR